HGERRPRLVNMYGITETTVHVTYRPLGESDLRRPGSSPIGVAIPDLPVFLVDAGLRPVPIGVPGEIVVAGAGLARCYLGRPALTAERFVPHPFSRFSHQPGERLYRSGDLARSLPDGGLEYLGRIDHQVKIRGFRIELGEVEAVMADHPGVRQAVVVLRGEGGGKRLVGYAVPAGEAPGAGELGDFLRHRLSEYMVPQAFVFLDALPLTPNGKVDRRALPEPSGERPELEQAFVAPRNPMEERLAEVWCQVLGLDRIGVRDNFFQVGGHSLLATQVTSRMRREHGVDLPLALVFERPTIAELAEASWELLLHKPAGQAGPDSEIGFSPLRVTGGPYPLSFSQERQWFLDQLAPGTPAYNIPTVLRLSGELCVGSLARSLREIVRRHESLRTSFPVAEGKAVQRVAPHLELPLPVVDLSALTDDDRRTVGARLAAREARHSFDLASGPLLCSTLLRLSAGEHRLIVVMHHIISDGWSLGVMQGEVAQLYAAFRDGRPSPLPELRLQYPDFACWQRRWLEGEVLERQLAFWRRQLAGVPVLELPTDHPRPPVQTFRGRSEPLRIDSELLAGLRGLAQAEGASLFMVILAAFKALLCRCSRQTDLAVGTFIANRTRAELENLIGFFVNNLALRTDLVGNPTVRELLQRVRHTTLDAYAHQDVPFEKLTEELRPERDMSRPSFFQVMCVLQNLPQAREALGGVGVSREGVGGGHVNFDLSIALIEDGDSLAGVLEYNVDLFEPATGRRLTEHLGRLLAAVAEAPDTSLHALPLLSPPERRQLLVEWNRTAAELPWQGGVHRLIAAWAERRPQAPAVAAAGDDEGQDVADLSYGELNARANQLGHYLRGLGVGPEVRVAISIGDEPERIVAVLAVLKAGGAFVPLDPDYSGERLGFMLADAGAELLLTTRALSAQLEGLAPAQRPVLLDAEAAAIAAHPTAELGVPVAPENLAYVVYTSGSTGRPKGVMVSHGALENAYRAWEKRYHLTRDAHCHLQMASFSFDVFVGDLVRALCSGGCLVLCPRELLLEPERLYERMIRRRVDAAEFVPAVVRGLLEHLERRDDADLGFMRLMVVGSDTWSMRELGAVAGRTEPATRVISSYGVSEATIDSTCFEPATLEAGDPF
ncbi:MAG: AMP-binding protein, partial [bacterium]|nr:AMP-binding protein [bacterium]